MTAVEELLAPVLAVNADGLSFHAGRLTREGPAFAENGSTVHQTWQGLAGVYLAPESAALRTATEPIKTVAQELGQEVGTVGTALNGFAAEVPPMQKEARELIAQAAAAEAASAADPEVQAMKGADVPSAYVPKSLQEEDRVLALAQALLARFRTAETGCADKIRVASGDRTINDPGDGPITRADYPNGSVLQVRDGVFYLNGVPLPARVGAGVPDSLARDFDNWLGEQEQQIDWRQLTGPDANAQLMKSYCGSHPGACGPDLVNQLAGVATAPMLPLEAGIGSFLKPLGRMLGFGEALPGIRALPGYAGSRIPHLPGHVTADNWNTAARLVQEKARELGGHAGVQGSRVAGTHRPNSDIDYGVKVSQQRFDDFLDQRRQTLTPGSARWKTLEVAAERGRIHGGEAGLRPLRKQLERELGMEVDLSLIKRGGLFDNGKWIMFGE